ncbi:MAG: threonine synthase [Lachnospiraceae bacterium]|nr:threonine synthase [Lachnospiraceae bacterium]
MIYKSTRGNDTRTASQAILKGLAQDGGLFIPEYIPKMEMPLKELAELDYRGLAYEVMKLYLTDFTEEELMACINNAYDDKFDTEAIAPLTYADGAYYLELFHGPTIAFKDMALQILPHLMTTAARKNDLKDDIVILTATSGDTGKAALEGFKDVPGTRIIVFYPKDGVSRVQEKQMLTTGGENTSVVGIYGNFDQAQTGVKNIFSDGDMASLLEEHGFVFSSANSINIGRLVPQVVYYWHAYLTLLREEKIADGEPVNICVPTGNFGNILAAYLAKEMGMPVNKLICASNSNKVLYDFFTTEVYDKNRDFFVTSSPSMDILVSSNLERLIYFITGDDPAKTAKLFGELNSEGRYEIDDEMNKGLAGFAAGFATEEETASEIAQVYNDTGYVIDTHTAVASFVNRQYREASGDEHACVIASTASPFKFGGSVMKAIDPSYEETDDYTLAEDLAKTAGVDIPQAVLILRDAPIRHDIQCAPEDMKDTVKKILGI